jgi:transporter family-2 protein
MRQLLAAVVPLLLAALAGVATAYQPGVNARFAQVVDSRIHAGVLSFAVGTLAMVVIALLVRAGIPSPERVASAPWWSFTGGLMGTFFVIMAIVLVPRIGTLNYLAAVIAGQFIASAVIDHFGHMGLAVREITPARMLGIGLVAAGVACVRLG